MNNLNRNEVWFMIFSYWGCILNSFQWPNNNNFLRELSALSFRFFPSSLMTVMHMNRFIHISICESVYLQKMDHSGTTFVHFHKQSKYGGAQTTEIREAQTTKIRVTNNKITSPTTNLRHSQS
jgi:hypothetical protein